MVRRFAPVRSFAGRFRRTSFGCGEHTQAAEYCNIFAPFGAYLRFIAGIEHFVALSGDILDRFPGTVVKSRRI
jgi:hypothetical protein